MVPEPSACPMSTRTEPMVAVPVAASSVRYGRGVGDPMSLRTISSTPAASLSGS
jgi:hypothetical protein